MATLRAAKVPVGSAQWFLNERRQANVLVEQEVEEFQYSARNELDWLNEHMADIFSANQLNVVDIFKTPGKLRGKTPRTVRNRNALDGRAPLSDIFAPTSQSKRISLPQTQFYDQMEQFHVAHDADARAPTGNADSGYHGMTEDEMEIDTLPTAPQPVQRHVQLPPTQEFQNPGSPSRAATEDPDSFVSAKEYGSKKTSLEDLRKQDGSRGPAKQQVQKFTQESGPSPARPPLAQLYPNPDVEMADVDDEDVAAHDDRMQLDDLRSPSDGPSPVPLLRKSSLTFSSLPAREALASKQSIGKRVSRTSHVGRTTGGKSIGASTTPAGDDMEDIVASDDQENVRPPLSRIESETTKMHNKSSTQRLHDRINMLGQMKDPRPSKSIHNLNQSANGARLSPSMTNELGRVEKGPPVPLKDHVLTARAVYDDDDEEDWIAPVQPKGLAAPPPGHLSPGNLPHSRDGGIADQPAYELRLPQHRSSDRAASPPKTGIFPQTKSISSSAVPSPTKAAMAVDPAKKAVSAAYAANPFVRDTNTPAGSPARRNVEGPISASKAKLYSVLRSAKGIFASSAAVSAQAKSEVLSPKRPKGKQPLTVEEPPVSPNPEVRPMPALYPNLGHATGAYPLPTSPTRVASPSRGEGRRTRSSTGREKEEKRKQREMKEQQRSANDLNKAREKERQHAAVRAQKSKPALREADSDTDMPPPPPPKSLLPTSHAANKGRELRRLMKPSKENINKSTGPPKPLTVHLASQRIGQHQAQPSTAALAAGLQDTLPPPAPSKNQDRPGPPKSTSTTSLATQSSNGTAKSSATSQAPRPRALDAAMRKKELEEKAAQRKAEQKREAEARRAAKVEEERKAEQQRKEEEQRRVMEVKKAAQRKAEEARRQEQQRREAAHPASRQGQASDLSSVLQQEQRLHGPPAYHRPDLAGARPLAQMNTVMPETLRTASIPINPAKPAKRALQIEPDDDGPVQRAGVQRNPYQQLDVKRRKTDEDEDEAEGRRSVMAPPIRHSNILKEPNKLPNGYMNASNHVAQSNSMFRATVTQQHQMQHAQAAAKMPSGHSHDIAKYGNGARIPFADAANGTAAAGPSAMTAGSQSFKTPLRPEGVTAIGSKSAARSSPHYPPGETIALPDILTDSEDEDSENEFVAPSWAASPFLNEALARQQLIDPETIFGPIQELKMDEIFKSKDKTKRWRDRTSSANWSGTDRLTEEERRRDRVGRERLMKQGGWSFDTVAE